MSSSTLPRVRLTLSEYREGILREDRVVLSRAITLVESRLEADQIMANTLIQELLPATGRAIRIGITGIPGVGKSSFIEVFGQYLTAIPKKIAILAVDPSSKGTKGSILGDKTRMEHLAKDKNAFIRPTPAGMVLGGVHDRTREVIRLCEATGFDVIIVETVGVGQSEVKVHEMVDFFMLLIMGGGGDELQSIKKGIMEMADGIVVTKADGENMERAREAKANCQGALHFFHSSQSGWVPKVLLFSALEKTGMRDIWDSIQDFKKFTLANGFFTTQRKRQVKEWFHSAVKDILRHEVTQTPSLKKNLHILEKQVTSGALIPPEAAQRFVKDIICFLSSSGKG